MSADQKKARPELRAHYGGCQSFADMTYEGMRGIAGQFFLTLGASATVLALSPDLANWPVTDCVPFLAIWPIKPIDTGPSFLSALPFNCSLSPRWPWPAIGRWPPRS